MHKILSTLVTLFCSGIILGIGYLVIIESGSKILENGRNLEEITYEDTNSNIFYGKIDEEIELFPWNYYPEDDTSYLTGYYPRFQEIVLTGDMGDEEEELKALQNYYIMQLIACESGSTTEEVWEWYDKQQKSIMDEIKMVTTFPIGTVYFYQDVLTLNKKQYQVRLACTDWDIISFICIENRAKEEQDRNKWEEGKEKLVKVLEQSESKMSEYFAYMTFLKNGNITSIYTGEDTYINSYLESFQWLNNILDSRNISSNIPEYILKAAIEEISIEKSAQEIYDMEKYEKNRISEEYENTSFNYSYQIIELKDMILLLIQGDETLGLYYDPIRQCFCGYNYFYES